MIYLVLGSGHTALRVHCCWGSTGISNVRSPLQYVYDGVQTTNHSVPRCSQSEHFDFGRLLAVSGVRMNVVVGWPSTLSINPRIYFLLPINRSIKQSEIRSKGHSSTSKYSTIRPRDIFKSAQPWSSANNTPEYTGRKLSLGLISQGIRREFGVENLRSIWATT